MGIVPIVLVVSAAGAHTGWNLVAKHAGGGVAFVWLCALCGLALFTPAALTQLLLRPRDLSLAGLGFMVGSGALHAGYFTSLQEGYAAGDLSLVYPLARGMAPLLSVVAAIVVPRERAAPLMLLGRSCLLTALKQAPVIFVAPAREISVILGVLAGANILGEGDVLRRAVASVAVLIAVALLAVG